MNLKDAILSTISEIEHVQEPAVEAISLDEEAPFHIQEKITITAEDEEVVPETISLVKSEILEDQFLQNLRDRILVLFEGFQSPNNVALESKIDLTLNFLEHLLAKIDQELEQKEGGKL